MNVFYKKKYILNRLSGILDFDSDQKTFLRVCLPYIFPVSYVSLILSGLLKGWMMVSLLNFKLDLTILFFFVSIVSFFLIEFSYSEFLETIKKKAFFISIFFLTIFLLWYNLTSLWSLSTEYYIKKMQCFLLIFSIFIFPIFCKNDFSDRFIKVFFIFSVFLTHVYFYSYMYDYSICPKSAYLTYSYVIGGILFFLISTKEIFFGMTARIFLISICALMFFIFGARSPLIFFTIVTVVWLISDLNKKNILFFFSLILFTMVAFSIYSKYLEPNGAQSSISLAIQRYELLLNLKSISYIDFNVPLSLLENKEEGMGSSANYRLVQYYHSIGYILSNPIKFFTGWGMGSYGILENGLDERNYPHNCILEIFVEAGFIGFILFIISFVCFSIHLLKANLLKTHFNLVLVTFYYCGFLLTSSSISEARIPFAFLGLLLLLSKKNLRQDLGLFEPCLQEKTLKLKERI